MTVQEKFEKIKEWCDKFDEHTCRICPLSETNFSHGGICYEVSTSDNDIEEMYRILFGNKEVYKNYEDYPVKVKSDGDPIKPNYYNDSEITPFNVIDDWNLDFYLGTAVKYIKRAGKKDGNSRLQDLQKAREYIEHEIELEEVSNND